MVLGACIPSNFPAFPMARSISVYQLSTFELILNRLLCFFLYTFFFLTCVLLCSLDGSCTFSLQELSHELWAMARHREDIGSHGLGKRASYPFLSSRMGACLVQKGSSLAVCLELLTTRKALRRCCNVDRRCASACRACCAHVVCTLMGDVRYVRCQVVL